MKIGNYTIDRFSAALGAGVVLALWIVFGGSGTRPAPSGHWYDFGNGMVNLDRVNLIRTGVNIGYEDDIKITDEGCEKAIKCLSEDDGIWQYPWNARGRVEFDDFTLTLESFEVKDASDVRKAFRSWQRTLEEIKRAQK